MACCWHLFVFEDWVFPTKESWLYLEGLVSITMFSMWGTGGAVNLAGLLEESQDMEEGEGAISELMVSILRLGVGE